MRRHRIPRHAGDVAVGALIVLFAVLALLLHGSVAGLGEMATSIRDAGVSIEEAGNQTGAEIRRGLGAAADSVEGLPLVGGQTGDALRRAADGTAGAVEREARRSGGELVAAGRAGERDARNTARLVGWLAFLVPTVLLLAQWLPGRLRLREE